MKSYSYAEEYRAYIRNDYYYLNIFRAHGIAPHWRLGSWDLLRLPQVRVPDTVLILQGLEL